MAKGDGQCGLPNSHSEKKCFENYRYMDIEAQSPRFYVDSASVLSSTSVFLTFRK